MKLKNVKAGMTVELKKDLIKSFLFDDDIKLQAGERLLVIYKEYQSDFFDENSVYVSYFNEKSFYVNHKDIQQVKSIDIKKVDNNVFMYSEYEDVEYFAIDKNGIGWYYIEEPTIMKDKKCWTNIDNLDLPIFLAGCGYDSPDWKNSLIKREYI